MVASQLAHDTIQKEVAEIWGGAHIYKFCMISLEGNVCPHVTYKHTMVNIFSGSTAKAKRQESEGEQQTVLHNAQEVSSSFVPRPHSAQLQIVRARETN